jgi:hypothetical protein
MRTETIQPENEMTYQITAKISDVFAYFPSRGHSRVELSGGTAAGREFLANLIGSDPSQPTPFSRAGWAIVQKRAHEAGLVTEEFGS